MFGYIKCYKPELKIVEYESYRAIYCGLCKRLQESFGILSSFTLSYDFAFLSLIEASINDTPIKIEAARRCTVNPLKKVSYCTNPEFLDYSCDVAMIMLYHKLKDNISDGLFVERTKSRLALTQFTRSYKKCKYKHEELCKIVEHNMNIQRKVELLNTKSFDEASDPSAKSLEYVFSQISSDPTQKRILERLGYFLGRWVYLIDAVDDLESDEKNGCFNILLSNSFGTNSFSDAVKIISPSINATLSEIINSYELLDIKKFKSILDNILYMGLKHVQDSILYKNI